jgi:hypothetical protein
MYSRIVLIIIVHILCRIAFIIIVLIILCIVLVILPPNLSAGRNGTMFYSSTP